MSRYAVEMLEQCFKYNPDTGSVIWSEHRPKDHFKTNDQYVHYMKTMALTEAGTNMVIHGTTYRLVRFRIQGVRYTTNAHRVAYALYYGYLPKVIDHVDGDGLNNKILNLRESCLISNPKNQKRRYDNKSGIGGVNWDKATSKWKVQVAINQKSVSLGYYSDFFEACCVRLSWLNNNNYSDQHGRR